MEGSQKHDFGQNFPSLNSQTRHGCCQGSLGAWFPNGHTAAEAADSRSRPSGPWLAQRSNPRPSSCLPRLRRESRQVPRFLEKTSHSKPPEGRGPCVPWARSASLQCLLLKGAAPARDSAPRFLHWLLCGERGTGRAPRPPVMSFYDINREQNYGKNSGDILGENELRPASQLHSLLEKIKTGFITEKIFETVSLSSDTVFQRAVAILHTSYLDSSSEHGFQYSQVTLVKNHIFLNEYRSFYQQKKASNYTQEELQETYGFLLFETESQAKLVCQRGVRVGSSAITTLGDPDKGVYISKYSDYLHPRPWYHGKSGYVVIFNLIKGKVKFVPENYTTNYTRPSFGYDCHVATNINNVSSKTSHFRAFELSQYYLYELSGNTVIERPRQICPYIIVAFQYKEPKNMETHGSIPELHKNVLISPWKGKLSIQGCLLCDIMLWSTYGTVIPAQLPSELDFKYVMKVSSLKKKLPEAAFKKQNYLEQKVCHHNMCFNLYEVELSNKQGEKIDRLREYIKTNELVLIKCLEDRGFFILLTSSALISDTGFDDGQLSLHGLHLSHSSLTIGMKDLNIEDSISLKVIPILPALNCALLEAKKSFTEEGIRPNTLVKHNFQALYKADKSPSLTAASQDEIKETTFFDKLSNGFDLVPPAEKCPLQSLTKLRSYFSDPDGYILEVCTALDLLAEPPQSPYFSDGICDAGFSLVMTPDPEFLDSEAEVRKETETEKTSEDIFQTRKGSMVLLSPVANLRVQPKRKASAPLTIQSKKVNLCRPFTKRAATGTSNGSDSATTLKLAKGQFPQKRKRGAEVLTAQFIQTAKLDPKNQDTPISKDVLASAKRTRKQEKSPVSTVLKVKQPVTKSPPKQRVYIIKGHPNPRVKKQPQPVKGETASKLQSGVSPEGKEDLVSINTAQQENDTMVQKDLPKNSVVSCDSQALNMLADLALSSAPSSTPSSSEPKNLSCSSELPQIDVMFAKENSLRGTFDHEYHRGVKSKKGGLLPKPSTEKKTNSVSDVTVNQDAENLIPCREQVPAKTQSALPEETQETSDASQSACVVVEHSYALLLAEHSLKQIQQRGIQGSTFAKNGTKGPEAGTPVGKVMPFRHQQNTSPLQKVIDPLIKHKNRLMSSSLRDFHCSHTVFSCDGSFKVTFKSETEYSFSLDSKYTNNPLEKTVIRALHGPWNTDLPDNMEEVKLLLHMWVALFYSNQNKIIQSSRKVVEHSNPAKYVSINSTIDSFDLSEIEEPYSVERCSTDSLLETKETSEDQATELSFPDTKAPFIKPQPARGLELCIQNEQKDTFTREAHQDNSESLNFIYSCSNEVIEKKAERESSDKVETSNGVLSSSDNTQIDASPVSNEDKTFQPLDSTRISSHNGTVLKDTFTETCEGINSPSVTCQQPTHSTLQSEVDIFHATEHEKTETVQDIIQHNSPTNKECQSSLERKDDNTGYVMTNLEPVPLISEENNCPPVQTEDVNRDDKSPVFNVELLKQEVPSKTLPVPTFKKTQTETLKDIPFPEVSGEKDSKCLSTTSVSKETLANEVSSLQKENPLPVWSSSSGNSLRTETVSLEKSSNCLVPSEEKRLSQDYFLQTQSLLSISSEEIIEPKLFEDLALSDSTFLISSRNNVSHGSMELMKNDKDCLNSENTDFELFNSAFRPTSLSLNKEEVSLELSEDSDIDLTLAISPLSSPSEQILADENEQFQEAPSSNVEHQDVAEERIDSGEVTLTGNGELNSDNILVSEDPLDEMERKDGNYQSFTFILPKDNSTPEISGHVNVTSDFPFNSLIEEVSPASSPDLLVTNEETRPSQAISPCSLKDHETQYEKSIKASKIESFNVALTEKENPSVGTAHPVGQDNLTWVKQMPHYAEMPLLLNSPTSGKDGRLTLPGKVTEEIAQSKHYEVLSFPENTLYCDVELNQPAAAAKYSQDFTPSLSLENRNLEDLTLETSKPMFTPSENTENVTDTFLHTTSSSSVINICIEQPTTSESIEKNITVNNDLKKNESIYLPVKFSNPDSLDGAVTAQAYTHSEISKLGSSPESATLINCIKPINVETGYQTHEIPVVKMANLLKRSEKAELHKESIDPEDNDFQSHTTSSKGEQTIHVLQDRPMYETKDLSDGVRSLTCPDSNQNAADTSENSNKELTAFFIPKSFDSLVGGISKDYMGNNTSEGLVAEDLSETLDRGMDISVNSDMHYELLSGDSDQDSFGDFRNPKLDVEDSCTLRCNYTRNRDGTTKGNYSSFMSINNSGDEEWRYSNRVPGLDTSVPFRNWSSGSKQENRRVPCYIQIRDLHGIPRTYANFTITKEFKDTTRTLHALRRHPSLTAKCGLISSWTSTWQIADDLTQNTLDLEYLRFAHKLKQLVKNGEPQHSTSSTSAFSQESPIQIAVDTFPLTKISESPVLYPIARSRSPLLVTVTHSDQCEKRNQHMRINHMASSMDGCSFCWKERCSHRRHLSDFERNQSFHLNKLKYDSTSKESLHDVSLILNEFPELSKVMINNEMVFQDKELNVASAEALSQELYPSFPRRPAFYENMITDLCTSLHVKLKNVMREACKSTFFFYLVETEDSTFIQRTKNILRKEGHSEIEPQHFCQAFHRENDTLIVIIRNEDISSHLHQIPSLLKLKHFPNVLFTGIDSPEDFLDHTYQELFRAGGFVVSDDKILETLTLVQLKEIVKVLDKLNGNGRWKWFLHYRENKKLKESVRVDSIAHKKNLIVKSSQSANIIEFLHYHQCDSRSSRKAENLKCLLNLQIQHIEARFAVFLTDKPTVFREVFENSGILVTDVNNFIENIQKVATPFRSSYW
ncbi:PREDICTED: protein FAM208B [Elephantulus edwardii]|uniref:protein FAM208B n=1 Tax=Elephantulus edwardii TaxID=28737 RepID=UPI0003F0CE71|nr:PREDICTED: protein FAM208B [Elephantulus edwardii]